MQPWYLASEKNRKSGTRAEDVRFFNALLDATGACVLITTAEGVITHFNRNAEQLLGYTAEEVVGKKKPLLFHDIDEVLDMARQGATPGGKIPEPVFGTVVERELATKEAYRATWTFVRKDRSRFRSHLTIMAARDQENRITAYAGIFTPEETPPPTSDGTFTPEHFRLLAENIPGVVYLCRNDETFSVVFLNDQTEAISGYPRDDFYSGKMNFSMIMHPDDRAHIPDRFRKSVAENAPYQLEYRIRHRTDGWRWLRDHGVAIHQNGELKLFEGFVQDITAQKETEAKLLRMAEENLRFFNNPVTLNVVADADGFLRRVSPSCTDLLGWTDAELRAEPVLHFVHPDDLDRMSEALKRIGKGEKVDTFESRFRAKNGNYCWLLWGCVPEPETRMAYCSAIDISARKVSEENILDSKSNLETLAIQLQAQNRKLDEFAHIVSHNLRAPANNIQALINLLSEGSNIEDYKLIFEKLKNVSKNLGETMNELLDTLRAQSDTRPEVHDIRFREVLDKVVQSLEGELIVAEASVTYDFNEAPSIRYSKPYLESIFQNLLTNAIKYRSPERAPAIHFHSAVVDDHVELKVSDNGRGINLEHHGHKLFGLHQTFHDHPEARGVGLFLVKNQIESLGGSIAATSEVDKGTTFTIRFPNS